MSSHSFDAAQFQQLVHRVADEYERLHPARVIPPAWRYQLIQNAANDEQAIRDWSAANPTSSSELRHRLIEQFDDAWQIVEAEPNGEQRRILLESGETALNESISRNCRFVFWCWGRERAPATNVQ